MKDYYEILGIDIDAGDKDIENAYRNLSREYTAGENPQKHAEILEAYQYLKKPGGRIFCKTFHQMSFYAKQAYALAESAMKEGRWKGAVQVLEKALKNEEFPEHLYYLLGIASFKDGKYAKAASTLNKLPRYYSQDVQVLECCALSYYRGKKLDKAAQYAMKGFDIDRNNASFLFILAEWMLGKEKYADADALLSSAEKNKHFRPYLQRIYFMLVRTAFYLDDLEAMFRHLECLCRKGPIQDNDRDYAEEKLTDILDVFLENEMKKEADKYLHLIAGLFPGSDLLDQYRQELDILNQLDKLMDIMEGDPAFSGILYPLITSAVIPPDMAGMTPEQQKAYIFMHEYFLLEDAEQHIATLRYVKNRYPQLYDVKKQFFDSVSVSAKRKALLAQYKQHLFEHQKIFNELMAEFEAQYDAQEDTDESEGIPLPVDADTEHASYSSEKDNVRPFVQKSGDTGRNHPCPCGSGKKYKNCCGKK